MAKYLTFAGGWNKSKNGYDFISCATKGTYTRLYDSDSKSGENINAEIIIRNKDSGEEFHLENFIVSENNNRREGKNDPDVDVKVKVSD